MVIDGRVRGGCASVGFILCFFVSVTASLGVHAQQHAGSNAQAPELEVYEWIQGGSVNAFPGGGVLVVTFGATWCPPCRKAAPFLARLAEGYGEDVHFAYIYTRESKPGEAFPEGFADRIHNQVTYGVGLSNFSVGLDGPGWTNADAWGVHGVPVSFLVGRKGEIVWKGSPFDLSILLETMLESGSLDSLVARMEAGRELRRVMVKKARMLKSVGECREALLVLDSLIARFPDDGGLLGQRFHVLAGYDNQKAYGLLNKMLGMQFAYMDWMNILAANIPVIDSFDRDYDTEIAVLKRAFREESNERFQVPILSMMAEAFAGGGRYCHARRTLGRAISLQEEQDGDAPVLRGYYTRLEQYRKMESQD